MPIRLTDLRAASTRSRLVKEASSRQEARAAGIQTAFLCHSHRDQLLARGLQTLLREHGWNLYIDWQDSSTPDRPNRETANRIKGKIRESDRFLFLATPNSVASRWCPWEIGYGDSAKGADEILVIPTTDHRPHWDMVWQLVPTTL